jgi:hypothetical protein
VTRSGVALAILLAGAGAGCAAPEREESTCVSCHTREEADIPQKVELDPGGVAHLEFEFSRPTAEWRESVHAAAEVSCDACHGGDPREPDEELSMSQAAGFLENPSWTELADWCGVCHEGIAAAYLRGGFGRAMREGTRVPTCVTCHMPAGHRIVASRPEEILTARFCLQCREIEDPRAALAVLERVRARGEEVEARVRASERSGIELADLVSALGWERIRWSEAVHEFELPRIQAASATILAAHDEIEAEALAFDREADARRRFGLVLLAALSLLFAALVALARARRRADGNGEATDGSGSGGKPG